MTAPGIDPLAIATEVPIGRMGRENAPTRALRLLVEGRVGIIRLDARGCLARVKGDSGEIRTVVFDHGVWSCDCPARSRCAHVRAVQLVAVVNVEGSSNSSHPPRNIREETS